MGYGTPRLTTTAATNHAVSAVSAATIFNVRQTFRMPTSLLHTVAQCR